MKKRTSPYQPASRYKHCPICGKVIMPRRNPRNVNPYDAGIPRDTCKCYK